MAEYIEREATIELLRSLGSRDYRREKGTIQEAIKMVSFPEYTKSADVTPVRHAKVIDKISDDHETIKPWEYRYYCSACKIPMRDSWNKYCPNCGAKMDLED